MIKTTIYDGQGHTIAINGVEVAKGHKRRKVTTRLVDVFRHDLLNALEAHSLKPYSKTQNRVEGLILRFPDADYTVKVSGHAKREYTEPFTLEKSYTTPGKTINHSSAIAKDIVNYLETNFQNDFQNSKMKILNIKASTIRISYMASNSKIENEFSIKITKKRSRVG